MNPLLLLTDQSEVAGASAVAFETVQLSHSEIAINHWIDIAAGWLDHFIFTPLLGPNRSELR